MFCFIYKSNNDQASLFKNKNEANENIDPCFHCSHVDSLSLVLKAQNVNK